MFQPLIGRICFSEWMTTEEIVQHIHDVCNGRWITDQIDWDPILEGIKYKENKTTGNTMIISSTSSPIINLNRFNVKKEWKFDGITP